MEINKLIAKLTDKVRNYYQTIKSLPDSTDKIAKGVALGFAFDFLPIPIISIPISYLVARLLRYNTVATVCTVIFFKLAVPFFYSMDFLTGQLLFGNVSGPEIVFQNNNVLTDSLEAMIEHGYPFLFGSLVNAILAYGIVYLLLKKLLKVNKKKGEKPQLEQNPR